MYEKRKYPRRPLQIQVQILPKGRPPFEVTSADISVGGMFLLGTGDVSFGEEVELVLPLPALGPTRLPAVVRWIRADGFGIQFGLLGALHTHELANLVDSVPPVSLA